MSFASVYIDANVLINLAIVDRLDLLGRLEGWSFLVPEEVVDEVQRQRALLERAIGRGFLEPVRVEDPGALLLREDLRELMGLGEAACLALAVDRGGFVACDEKRAFLREARRRLGRRRILNTPGLLVQAIRQGALSVEGADVIKDTLAKNRFVMKIDSFGALV